MREAWRGVTCLVLALLSISSLMQERGSSLTAPSHFLIQERHVKPFAIHHTIESLHSVLYKDTRHSDARVKSAISVDLRYSCVHWPSHAGDALREEQACKQISDLLKCFFS